MSCLVSGISMNTMSPTTKLRPPIVKKNTDTVMQCSKVASSRPS